MNPRPYLDQRVALFGSWASRWREDIAIPLLTAAHVPYFNPIVPTWTSESMRHEAEHAAHDAVIMVVITGESTGFASLIDLMASAAFARDSGQQVVAVIEDMPPGKTPTKDEFGGALNPNANRELLRKYLAQLSTTGASSVHLCTSVHEATRRAIELLIPHPVS